jgi:hypothetical protein
MSRNNAQHVLAVRDFAANLNAALSRAEQIRQAAQFRIAAMQQGRSPRINLEDLEAEVLRLGSAIEDLRAQVAEFHQRLQNIPRPRQNSQAQVTATGQ